MLAYVDRLFHRHGCLALKDKGIEVLPQQKADRVRKRSHDAVFDPGDKVEQGQRPVLKDRVGVQNQQSGFHKRKMVGRSNSRKLARNPPASRGIYLRQGFFGGGAGKASGAIS